MTTQMTTMGDEAGLALGRGIDAADARRPGVPMELDPPRPAGNAHWLQPDRQIDPGNVLRRESLTELTPVFGTAVPPRSLSGMIRRAAYRIPEHRTSHWFALLFADRVDALEHGSARVMVPGFFAAAGLALFFGLRRR